MLAGELRPRESSFARSANSSWHSPPASTGLSSTAASIMATSASAFLNCWLPPVAATR